MPYKVALTRAARRSLASAPKNQVKRLDQSILELAENPYPDDCVKLEGRSDFWRVLVGHYRIVYQVESDRLVIVLVKLRRFLSDR